MTRYLALLRGINVGGHNRIAMAELAQMATADGLDHVSTHIQSGNLLFTSRRGSRRLEADLQRGITNTFGLTVPVVVRTAEQLALTHAANPYLDPADKPADVHTFFLKDSPLVAELDPTRSPNDRYRVMGDGVSGDVVHVWFRDGAGRSKITSPWLDKQLGTIGTARNAKTIAKLLELLKG